MPVLTEEQASHWLTWVKAALTQDTMELQFDLLAQNKSHPSMFPDYFHLQFKRVLCGLFCSPYGYTQLQFSRRRDMALWLHAIRSCRYL